MGHMRIARPASLLLPVALSLAFGASCLERESDVASGDGGPTGLLRGSSGGDTGSTGAGGATEASGAGGSTGTGGAGAGAGGKSGAGGKTGAGTGGAVGAGGATGAGGAVGYGGTIGAGGKVGAGGATGAGGKIAAGGATGAGGGGVGGVSGAGGSGAAGRAGGGGRGGRNGALCDQLVTKYADAMTKAKSCHPNTDNQCTMTAPSTLDPCPTCSTHVNDTTDLTLIHQEWDDAGCATAPMICPQILCVLPGPGACVSSTSDGQGMCVDQKTPPLPAPAP
jgi:hypothetical protein